MLPPKCTEERGSWTRDRIPEGVTVPSRGQGTTVAVSMSVHTGKGLRGQTKDTSSLKGLLGVVTSTKVAPQTTESPVSSSHKSFIEHRKSVIDKRLELPSSVLVTVLGRIIMSNRVLSSYGGTSKSNPESKTLHPINQTSQGPGKEGTFWEPKILPVTY